MNKNKFIKLIKGLQSAYPNFKLVDTQEGLEMWYAMLQDIDYTNLSLAVQKHIATSKYPPSIADIRNLATNLTEPTKNWGDGWELVVRAIHKYGYYSEGEALQFIRSHDDTAYKTTKRLDFKTICISQDLTPIRANFRMIYEQEQEQNQINKVLPNGYKKQLDELIKAKGIGGNGGLQQIQSC